MTDINKTLEEQQAPSLVAKLSSIESSPLKRISEDEKEHEDAKNSKRPRVVADRSNSPAGITTAAAAISTSTTTTNSNNTKYISRTALPNDANPVVVVTPTSTTTEPASTNGERPSKAEAAAAKEKNGSSAPAVPAPSTTTKPKPNNDQTTTGATSTTAAAAATLDLADTLGLKTGAQIEVQWEIHNRGGTEKDEGENETKQSAEERGTGARNDNDDTTTVSLHWWKATLLEHDGRTTDSVAVRSLLYEARPDLGFPEASREDVVFLGKDVLVTSTETDSGEWEKDPDAVREMPYRRVHNGDNPDEVFFYNDDQLDDQLNGLLMGAFHKNQRAWKAMPAAQQALIAEMIQKKKEQLKDVLRAEAKNKVITSETIKDILAKTF